MMFNVVFFFNANKLIKVVMQILIIILSIYSCKGRQNCTCNLLVFQRKFSKKKKVITLHSEIKILPIAIIYANVKINLQFINLFFYFIILLFKMEMS